MLVISLSALGVALPGRYVVLRIEPALLSRPFGLPSLTHQKY
ncbi:hypothetical protein [Enterobacter hormaechei]